MRGRHDYNDYNKGFTLLELLVVIAIIGILAAIAIPAYSSFKDKAKIAQAQSDLKTIQIAVEQLAIDTNRWPGPNTIGVTADIEIWDLTASSAGLIAATAAFVDWRGPYLPSIPLDPWGKNYFFDPDYSINGKNFVVLGSFGPNKCCPNAYDADDVIILLPSS